MRGPRRMLALGFRDEAVKLSPNARRPVSVDPREREIVKPNAQVSGQGVGVSYEAGGGALSELERIELDRRRGIADHQIDEVLRNGALLFPQKSVGTNQEAFGVMPADKSNVTVKRLARLLGSGVSTWLGRAPSARLIGQRWARPEIAHFHAGPLGPTVRRGLSPITART
jgi:hypothetical protein